MDIGTHGRGDGLPVPECLDGSFRGLFPDEEGSQSFRELGAGSPGPAFAFEGFVPGKQSHGGGTPVLGKRSRLFFADGRGLAFDGVFHA